MKSIKIQCNMFKCFKNKSDAYHDTHTYYLLEKDSFPFRDQAGVNNIVAGDMCSALKKRGALRGHA
jgi:hypothetical protein